MSRRRACLTAPAVAFAVALAGCGEDEKKAKPAPAGSAAAARECLEAAKQVPGVLSREKAIKACENVAAAVPDVEPISKIALIQCLEIVRQAIPDAAERKQAEANCRKLHR